MFRKSLYPPTIHEDPQAGGVLTVKERIRFLSPQFSILLGETVYNLRAALDYLIYELAILDSCQVQKGTQFPIEDTEQGWRRRWKGVIINRKGKPIRGGCYLPGLALRHKASIRFLQPCYGCNWTRRLRIISNPDKHRTLTVVGGTQTTVRRSAGTGPTILDPSRQGQTVLLHVSTRRDRRPMNMDTEIAFDIAFDDGTHVIETLQELQTQVADVIDVFEPEFEAKFP